MILQSTNSPRKTDVICGLQRCVSMFTIPTHIRKMPACTVRYLGSWRVISKHRSYAAVTGKIWDFNRIPMHSNAIYIYITHFIWITASQQCLLHVTFYGCSEMVDPNIGSSLYHSIYYMSNINELPDGILFHWFCKCTPPWMFLSLDIPSEYRPEYVTFGLLCVIFEFPSRIFCRRVPGFATDCPCGVWCHGLTTCLLYVGPPLEF